eukprot:CAMPEP_0118901564 /NCGR_PEP_ID=MMETSP1166-20130328/7222_1 /TAXON_ID=1104430 /ORGANISM="Chrysoreinhardia sp, Strain CCMP3193" /LENGTH=364 /DNA_ID=CAMNT_0006840741 /DNA_START=55 /DNA_END=1149 /DNA_ORIENTATION=+
MRVLWTGFGPFGEGEKRIERNPSQALAEQMEGDERSIVEVSMEAVERCVEEIALREADVCIHLGVAASYTRVTLERTAHNEATFKCPDESGAHPRSCAVEASAPETLTTTVDCDAAADELRGQGLDVDVSDDADRFLCNYIYFKSLRRKAAPASLFVHVPPFDVVGQEDQLRILRALRAILTRRPTTSLASQLKELGIADDDAQRAINRGAANVDHAMEVLFGGQLATPEDDAEEENSEDADESKLVLVVRTDVAMSRGKIAAQSAHAALGAYRTVVERNPALALDWIDKSGEKTIVCAPPPTQTWDAFLATAIPKADRANVATFLVHDAGRTEVASGTSTVLAVGPALSAHIDPITRSLPLLN